VRDAIAHDFSTSVAGIVPQAERRRRWHFTAFWTTLAANFSFLFLGSALYDGGFDFIATVGITVLGCSLYIAYALFASYLGSRSGQTHGLLTRSIFGGVGSWVVSAFLVIAPLGWVGFTAGLLAQTWEGLYGGDHLETLTVVLAVIMIINNLLGFTGISAFARYLVAPLTILWVSYFVARALIVDGGALGEGSPHGSLPFWAAVGSVIGFAMWGNEPDVWRYGKPKMLWPLPSYVFAYSWFVLFVTAGWIMSRLSESTDFGVQVHFIADYSLFGASGLALFVATVSLFAVNDGNYYESINAGQNLIGAWSRWRRPMTCVVVAVGGGVAAYVVNFEFVDGWFKVAGFLAITAPAATVIMVVDQLVLPRLFGIRRPLRPIPAWDEVGLANWPAIVALLVAVGYGAYASSLLSSTAIEKRYWGPVPLTVWVIAALLYLTLVAVVRAVAPASLRRTLGYSSTVGGNASD
jgi:purine-cytosine permease-like protein